ncbi:hypothetical protein GCM10022381_18710 [Leifsonia kafniensis]|uniref:DUF11 domain-containing protein n=1 Tax=Leifsonia kafniensis TaxID=475957 RepID=A0ABP7KG38_9MICO
MRVLSVTAIAALLAASFTSFGLAGAASAASAATPEISVAAADLPAEASAQVLDASATLPAALCTPDQQRATERFWRFGTAAGIDFGVSGTTATPFVATGDTSEGSTVITDASGSLLFWANGESIFNRHDVAMSNGTGLLGNPSATQTVAAFPLMFQPGKYVVATTSTDVGPPGPNGNLTYSVVDMALDGGDGAVVATQKNLPLGAVNTASEALTAIPNADGTGFWVLTYTNNSPNVLAYKFDGNGYTGTVVTSVLPSNNMNGYGTLSLSPDRTKLLASTNQAPAVSTATGVAKLRLLEFNASTGAIAQTAEWAGAVSQGRRGYSADFSPSGDYVYFSRIFDTGGLFRYTISGAATAASIKASETLIGRIGTSGGQVKRGPDGRMYIASRGVAALTVIKTPDAPSGATPALTTTAVGYAGHGYPLPAGSVSQFGLPQMVTGCLSLDFGDAPDSYGTLLENSGAVHSLKSGLTLGSEWDEESNGRPTASANGDDTNGTVNDEDGLAAALTVGPGRATLATVTATNTTGTEATLAGWIDLNGNGTFEPGERQTLAVPANSGTANYALTWPAQGAVQATFARFRLFDGAVATPSPQGSAVGGEVEDYPVAVSSYTVAKHASVPSAHPGDTVDYTVTVTNTGNVAFTTSQPATFTDDLSGVLDDATVVAGSVTPGAVVAGNTLSWSGALAVGETKTITYTVTVTDPRSGDGVLSNVVVPGANGQCDPAGVCATTTSVNSFAVVKSTTATAVVAGEVIPFTITVTNTGQVDYTTADPASFSDDLSAVLDDATYNGDADDDAGHDVSYSSGILSWSGPLAAGASVTITYSVTVNDPATGNSKLANTVVTPPGSGGDCPTGSANLNCVVHVPGQSYTLSKLASKTSVVAGGTVEYTVTVTNTGAVDYTTDAPASFSDDLSGVLDDASYLAGSATNGATVTGNTLNWSGALAVDETKTISYSVRVNNPVAGDQLLKNSVAATTRGGTCLPGLCATTTPVASFTVSKAASGASVILGGTVTYTVTVTNTGTAAYTAGSPAAFSDDLSEVLDDATYVVGSATNGATLTGSTLNWSGALAVGASVDVSYAVTLKTPAAGDQALTNTVVPDAATGGACDPASACTVTTTVRSFTVAKAASAATVHPGSTVSYDVTVTNTGTADYTATEPAAFTDDLSAVLDDATFNDDASGGATVDPATGILSWSGALAVGATETITYSVTVNSPNSGNTVLADSVLVNTVVPDATVGGGCATAADCTTTTAVQSFAVAKSASATSVLPGGTITYAVTVTNTGMVAYSVGAPASFTDDLTGVLDDATYNAGSATNGATVTASTLSWSGALAIGATQTITYSVTANGATAGSHVLSNSVTPDASAGGTCLVAAECTTATPVQSFSVLKSTTATTVTPGDTVEYTIDVTNTGQVDYTAGNPASFTDDLSAVLDDATYNNDADNGAGFTDPVLTWSGALLIGETVTITYSVTVNDPITGDSQLANTVVTPPGSGGDCGVASNNLNCEAHVPGQSYTVAKAVSDPSAIAGDTVEYTVTVTNTGAVDYTTDTPASFSDDLSAVLDDASYVANSATNGAVVSGNTLTWAGALAVGASVDVTYSVTVTGAATGDGLLTNAVVPTNRGGGCDPAGVCETTTTVSAFTAEKAVSAGVAAPGETVSYTVTVTNTGQTAYTVAAPASFFDDLSAVLDDATYNSDASPGAAVNSTTKVLTWSGELAVGASVDVTYSVTVNTPDLGNKVLTNEVVPDASIGGLCDPLAECTVTTNVRSFTTAKTASASSIHPGSTVTYTVTVANTGTADYTVAAPASFTDDLSAVLDDATYNGDASAGVTVDTTTTNVLSWSGALAVGATVTITYSVTVNAPNSGDGTLTNAVLPDATTGGGCATAADCTATTQVQSFDVAKTASATSAFPSSTITYAVTVTNTGTVDYPAGGPASFTDNLAAVLDDANYNGDATNGATVTGSVLSWSGPLAVGASETITYSVTVGAPGTGDSVLHNAVVTPPNSGGSCLAGSTDPLCSTVTPVASFQVSKTTDATTVTPGETVAYTVTVTNTGAVDYTAAAPASFTDDMSDVLDDASYNNDADGGATYAAPTLAWSGALAVGETITVGYSLTVNSPNTGDGKLVNSVVTPPNMGGGCPTGSTNSACTTQVPGPMLKLVKTQSSETVLPGNTVTYTVTVENTGEGDFTAANPAAFTDNLSRVLDDASYNDDASNGASVTGGLLSWSGALASGATETITYSVSVTGDSTGDHQLFNSVQTPPSVTSNCAIGSTNPECSTVAKASSFTVSKAADVASAKPGQVVSYTVTVSNTGQTAYTADAPASFTDDLSNVLDDATYNADASNGATVVDGVLTWSGPIAAGATTTVSYSVTVTGAASGDHTLTNVVIPAASTGGGCATAGSCATDTPVSTSPVTPVTPTTPPTAPPVTPTTPGAPGAPVTSLASTGVEAGLWTGLAALLLGAGGVALLVTRRIRHVGRRR